jgi:hypothetical protein
MPSVNMAISPTCQTIPSDSPIPPSLSSFAYPLIVESQPIPSNQRQQRRKRCLVSLRNWNGEEISNVLWPTNFVPFFSSLSPNEETYSSLSELSGGHTNLDETSYLVLPPKNYSYLPSTFDDHDIQRILHKYRVKYVPEDIVDQPHFSSSLVEFEIPEEVPDENDLQETDRLSSLLAVNFDAEEDHDRHRNNGRLSLDDMLSDLSDKLSYFDHDQHVQRFDNHSPTHLSLPLYIACSQQEDSNPSDPIDQHEIPPQTFSLPSSSHSNLYRGLAEQIYFAELEAEDFFQQLTRYELDPQDILFVNSKTSHAVTAPTPAAPASFTSCDSNPRESDGVQEYELTSELIVPPNQVVGLYDRVTSLSPSPSVA